MRQRVRAAAKLAGMSHYTAILDANVLYPAPIRDILIEVAATDLFKAKWSADIHREWTGGDSREGLAALLTR